MVFELKNIYKDYLQGKEAVPVLKDISLDVSGHRIKYSASR